MFNQNSAFTAFPNGSFGMTGSSQPRPAAAKNDIDAFSPFDSNSRSNESGGFSLFGLFGKEKAPTLNDLVPDNPWLDNRFYREATPEESETPASEGIVMDQFNMAYRSLI